MAQKPILNYEVTQLKITNSEIIRSGERELIDTITGDLDWDTIEKIVRERHRLNIQDDIQYKQGDIIVHDNKVAYRLDFDIKMSLSVIFDRDGNCLSVTTEGDSSQATDMEADAQLPEDDELLEEMDPMEMAEDTDPGDGLSAMGTKILMPEMVEPPPDIKPEKNPQENISLMASHIAEMISQINEDLPSRKRNNETD
jgi:hypothetical protein